MFQQSNTPDIDLSSRNISKKPRRPHTKTRTGCRICRRRKVKCDETHPTCKNCQRRGLDAECDYEYSAAAHRVATGSWMQPQGHDQLSGPALKGILNVPLPATAATRPVPAFVTRSAEGVPVASGWPIPGGDPIQHATPIAAAVEFTPWSARSSSTWTSPRVHDWPCDASTWNPHSQYSSARTHIPQSHTSTQLHTSTQSPPYTPSPLHFTLSTQTPLPNGLTTATLIHLFTTLTAYSCSSQRAVQRVFAVHAPRLALRLARTHPAEMGYLLYSLLAIAALHAAALTSQTRSGEREKDMRRWWMTVAGEYHALTVEKFMVAVQKYGARLAGSQDAGLQDAEIQRTGDEELGAKLAKLTTRDVVKGHVYKEAGSELGSEGRCKDGGTVPVLAKSVPSEEREEKKGWAGRHSAVRRNLRVLQNKERAAELFSKLDRESVDEIEAILLASAFLTVYAIASDNLDSESLSSNAATTTSSPKPAAPAQKSTATTPATTYTTDTTSATTNSMIRRPMLSWVPLLRGSPTVIYHSPLGWLTFTQGHLEPLSAGLFKGIVLDHPYQLKLNHLHQILFTQAYIPHPKLPQPLYPITADLFQNAMEMLTQCFARFFGGGDCLGAAMTFPAAVEEGFFMGLGIEGGRLSDDGGGVRGAARARGHMGRKDPRGLVVTAYALVLLVLAMELFPEYGEELLIGEHVCGVLGIDLDHGEGSDSGCDEGECRHPQNHPANVLSPTWWIAGIGEREITEIARHLDALDKEEWWANGMDFRMAEGRWMKWMEWPLEIVRDRGKDVMEMLKEAVQKNSGN